MNHLSARITSTVQEPEPFTIFGLLDDHTIAT